MRVPGYGSDDVEVNVPFQAKHPGKVGVKLKENEIKLSNVFVVVVFLLALQAIINKHSAKEKYLLYFIQKLYFLANIVK
jgi:hypothetical protein